MGWPGILPVFLLLWHVNVYLRVPFSGLFFSILSISAYIGKNFCTTLPALTRPSNSWGSWKNDLSGLWYVSDITPSWMGNFPWIPYWVLG